MLRVEVMPDDLLNELHEAAAHLDADRRHIVQVLNELTGRLLVEVRSPDLRRLVHTALGLTIRLLGVQDALVATVPWATLSCVGGWRILIGRESPAHITATPALTDDQLYAVLRAIQALPRDDTPSVAQALRDTLPDATVLLLEYQMCYEVAMTPEQLWVVLADSVRETARLVTVPKEIDDGK